VLRCEVWPDPEHEDAEIVQEAYERNDEVGIDGPRVQMELPYPASLNRGLPQAPVEREDLLGFADIDELEEMGEWDGRA
jgi:hypothetical protein